MKFDGADQGVMVEVQKHTCSREGITAMNLREGRWWAAPGNSSRVFLEAVSFLLAVFCRGYLAVCSAAAMRGLRRCKGLGRKEERKETSQQTGSYRPRPD